MRREQTVSGASQAGRGRPPARGGSARGGGPGGGGRRRASHSLESVVSEAVALLDEAGEQGLTFRALAARLGTGVGSIYWYVASKDELLERAADQVLAGVLTQTTHLGGDEDPIDGIRQIAIAFYAATVNRPWLGSYFLQDTGTQINGLTLYDRMGRETMRLDLTPRQRFDAVSAVMAFVVGVAADRGQDPPQEVRDGTIDRDVFVASFRDQMRELGADDFPFLHHIADEFAAHDDAEQFRAGLDLLLAGIRQQAHR
ncbi:TetR family transcriptional regulator [Cellulomonas sp. JH27-2]|uniref:TetR/AcrR family transcriptional regulator n=1 Tax=Cellulomonas sp. JH27-2 TaxID=2774139 RepID=UPI00177B52C1|nr:TetR family transcriptional regulator [Cellulomonas sp. JH27-2]MBD8057957.1 TetR family transcriptional regulator [Cellulomonas sp. JH27-2]